MASGMLGPDTQAFDAGYYLAPAVAMQGTPFRNDFVDLQAQQEGGWG